MTHTDYDSYPITTTATGGCLRFLSAYDYVVVTLFIVICIALPSFVNSVALVYCRSGNIREVLIFADVARRTNSRIQESRENCYYNSDTEEK